MCSSGAMESSAWHGLLHSPSPHPETQTAAAGEVKGRIGLCRRILLVLTLASTNQMSSHHACSVKHRTPRYWGGSERPSLDVV